MTPNELVLTFRGSYVCANFCENRSRNATVRVLADGQTDRQTDTHTHTHTHTHTQTDFIICPVLYAIAMGQIKMISYNSYKYSDKWTKIGLNIGICLGKSHDNFQLHRFTTSENIKKSFRGATFLTHTVHKSTCGQLSQTGRRCSQSGSQQQGDQLTRTYVFYPVAIETAGIYLVVAPLGER